MTTLTETTDITLDITQGHLDRGIREHCGACPIALAFREAVPGARNVQVGAHSIKFFAAGYTKRHVIRLPMAGQELVQAFDHGTAEPITFEVAIPSFLANLPGFLADETDLAPIAMEDSPL